MNRGLRVLIVASILAVLVGLVAVGMWRLEANGVSRHFVMGVAFIVFGAAFTALHLTLSDDWLRRHFGEPGAVQMRRGLRSGWFGMLLGVAFIGLLTLDRWILQSAIQSGKAHLQAKEYTQAIELFSRAIEIDPKSADAYHGRAMAYLHQRESDRALANLDQALQLAPGDPKIISNRGVAYFQKADYDRALSEFSEAIRLDPNSARAYLARSRAHAKKGNQAQATADQQKAAELDPSLEKSRDGIP